VKNLEYSCCIVDDFVGDGGILPRVAREGYEKVLKIFVRDDTIGGLGRW
jgi:hypothetical protein